MFAKLSAESLCDLRSLYDGGGVEGLGQSRVRVHNVRNPLAPVAQFGDIHDLNSPQTAAIQSVRAAITISTFFHHLFGLQSPCFTLRWSQRVLGRVSLMAVYDLDPFPLMEAKLPVPFTSENGQMTYDGMVARHCGGCS